MTSKLACMMILACAACGGTVTNVDGDSGTDGGSSKDATSTTDAISTTDVTVPPFDAGTFCSGSSPRLQINGADITVMKSTGKAIILNCCDSAELTLATSSFQALMNILWRVPAATNGTIDLASPPQGFMIEMDLGCDPSTTSCATASPEERYTDGFTGTIDYKYSSAGLVVGYCLQVAESASQPHQVIHSMALYAPNVTSP